MTKKSTAEQETSESSRPTIEFNDRTIQSFISKGFADNIPHSISAPNIRMKQFISKVDLSKDFQRKILIITRFKTRDYLSDSKKKEVKEDITYREQWSGYNWLGEKLGNDENLEGVFSQVESSPKVEFNNETGRSEVVGNNFAGTHDVHYIPFTKETVDKIIAKSDSDKSEILFCVSSPPRRDYFTYDEFVNYTWDQLEEILLMPGGAKAARAKRIMDNDGKDKMLTAHNTMRLQAILDR